MLRAVNGPGSISSPFARSCRTKRNSERSSRASRYLWSADFASSERNTMRVLSPLPRTVNSSRFTLMSFRFSFAHSPTRMPVEKRSCKIALSRSCTMGGVLVFHGASRRRASSFGSRKPTWREPWRASSIFSGLNDLMSRFARYLRKLRSAVM